MINLTIDGKNVAVPEGTTVLRAAQANGIFIPTLCDHKNLQPFGGCRLCLVEVEGARTLQPSCTLPASDKMVVRTDTEKVRAMRKFVLTLLFSERNHFCPYCQVSGGDCELQNAAYREDMTHWPLPPNWQTYPVDASHEYFVLDNNRCILCRRCVRACSELVGNFTLTIAERGIENILVADTGVPLGESTCISCGTCVQVCPTGAIIDKQSAYHGKEAQVQTTTSVCVGCSVGCQVNVLSRDNQLVRILGDDNAALNQGVICKTGRFLPLAENRERIHTPLVRKNGELKAATWEEAFKVIAENMKPLVGKGEDGVAALASTRLPAEALALFKQIFADQFKSKMVTSTEEGQPSALPAAVAEELGRSFEGKLSDLASADCIVAFGANLVDSHEVAGFFVKRALPNGAKLVVIDPKENDLDLLTEYTLKAAKGSDLDVIQALQAGIVKLGLAKAQPAGLDAKKVLAELSGKTGLAEQQVLDVAGVIAKAKKAVVVYGKGITASNKQTLKALIELAQIAGLGLISVKGEANSFAAAQYRLDQPFALNGHKAVYVALGDDQASQRLIQRLEKAPFLAVQASYVSRLTAMANVVVPVEMWAEQSGHYVSLDGRVQEAKNAIAAPEDIRSNVAVLQSLAAQLGLKADADWKNALKQRMPVTAIEEN